MSTTRKEYGALVVAKGFVDIGKVKVIDSNEEDLTRWVTNRNKHYGKTVFEVVERTITVSEWTKK